MLNKSRLETEKELSVGRDLSESEGRRFKKEPAINVIPKDEMEERIRKVFNLLYQTLSRSFGPGGAHTIIYKYPYRHFTKDGFTIMKNLSMDASETLVDQAIADMAESICGRLNFAVGDGTTTAMVATNSIYQSYIKYKKMLEENHLLPRDVMRHFEILRDKIIENIQKDVVAVRSDDPEELYKNIYDVVYISSNGDEVISSYIAELYKELGCPAINCQLSTDGETRKLLIDGYKFNMSLNDKTYVNSDDETMYLDEADVIIFSTKVTKEIYEKVLVPLNEYSRYLGRHLIVAAPMYDETALSQKIARDFKNEYQKRQDVNMVLTCYKAMSAHAKRLVNDFAVLVNTTIIDAPAIRDIIAKLDKNGYDITQIFNITNRHITGVTECRTNRNYDRPKFVKYIYGMESVSNEEVYVEPSFIEENIRIGYSKDISLGMKHSVFRKFFYDENEYRNIYDDAKAILKETEEKYKKLGTFNLEVSQAQERFYSLNLKMGIIEVGGDSDMSQKLLKDAVDDAVKAAASAFNYGVVQGCNLSLINAIESTINEDTSEVDRVLINILYYGFIDVYKTVLNNAYEDKLLNENDDIETAYVEFVSAYEMNIGDFSNIKWDDELLNKSLRISRNDKESKFTLIDVIVRYSILSHQVFDVSKKEFTKNVINSSQTDKEVLKATIDLISLLIVGNQMVVTMRGNFE